MEKNLIVKELSVASKLSPKSFTAGDEIVLIPGPQGEQGPKGDSAFDVAVAEGFKGTEAEWLASLVGPKGNDGKQGPAGKDGVQGPQGPQGESGKDGSSGVYVGTTEPIDDEMLIWINPEGTATEALATEAYVNNAISAAIGEIENGSY